MTGTEMMHLLGLLHRLQLTKEDSENILTEVLTIAVTRNHNVDLAKIVLESNNRAVRILTAYPQRMR